MCESSSEPKLNHRGGYIGDREWVRRDSSPTAGEKESKATLPPSFVFRVQLGMLTTPTSLVITPRPATAFKVTDAWTLNTHYNGLQIIRGPAVIKGVHIGEVVLVVMINVRPGPLKPNDPIFWGHVTGFTSTFDRCLAVYNWINFQIM